LSTKLTDNLSPEEPELAPATRAILRLRQQVIHTWSQNVRRAIPKAASLHTPIIENTLPGFFDSLAALLTNQESLQAHADLYAFASEHGGGRARLTSYDSISVIHELQIFRDTLFTELEKGGVRLSAAQRQMVNAYIDTAIRDSANSFVLVQSALREQFIAAMTHDLRTPLSNAQVCAQLIERKSDNPDIKRLAGKILENTQRIEHMSRSLLDKIVFSTGNQLKLDISKFDLVEMVRDVAQYAQSVHAIDLRLPAKPITGHWSRELLRRAVENLITNAIKYGEPESPVRIQVSTTEGRVIISVHNKGKPIPPEDIEAIFQLYRRAARAQGRQEGWGMGLPFVRKVAEAHGGSVIVSSSAADGTAFMINLPRDARPFKNAPSVA